MATRSNLQKRVQETCISQVPQSGHDSLCADMVSMRNVLFPRYIRSASFRLASVLTDAGFGSRRRRTNTPRAAAPSPTDVATAVTPLIFVEFDLSSAHVRSCAIACECKAQNNRDNYAFFATSPKTSGCKNSEMTCAPLMEMSHSSNGKAQGVQTIRYAFKQLLKNESAKDVIRRKELQTVSVMRSVRACASGMPASERLST